MKNFLTIFKREFAAYFNTPTAYIYLIIFLVMTSGMFMTNFFVSGNATMRSFFGTLPFFLCVFIPAVSMRLWSEERKLGTMALVLSFPMKNSTPVLGKFFACLAFYALALAGTLPIPIMIAMVGNPDLGAIVGAYIGALLLGGFYLAIGIFISAFFKDQIVTLILSILCCFATYMLGNEFVASFMDGWVDGLGSLIQNGLGAAKHYDAFTRGIIDIQGMVYFVGFTAILLILNSFTLESFIRRKPKGRFAISVVFLLCIGFMLNLVTSETRLDRVDLTEGGLYTVSKESERILGRLVAPVEVNYYVSPREKLPSFMKNIQQDVEDKLSDLARLNKSFHYNVYNPLADASKLAELEKKGVAPFQTQSIEKDSMDIKSVYSAVTISYLDKKVETIDRVMPQMLGSLEYELMSKIYRMTLPEQPVITMVAPIEPVPEQYKDPRMREFLQKMGQKVPEETDNFSQAMEMLRHEGYGVARMKFNEKEHILKDSKTLLLLDPHPFDKRQLYEITRFLARGGSVFLASQQYRFQFLPQQGGMLAVVPMIAPNNANELLMPYGLAFKPGILMDANAEQVTLNIPQKISGVLQSMVKAQVKFPMQIHVPDQQMNGKLALNNRIASLFYIWGSATGPDDKRIRELGLKKDVIFTSSPQTWTVPYARAALAPAQIDKDANTLIGPQPLAVRLTGLFPDFFEGKAVPEWPEEGKSREDSAPRSEIAPAIDRQPGSLIFVPCADMFSNQAIGVGNNSLFLLNAIDSLTLGDELIAIRSKSQTLRLIRETTAGEKLFYRFFTTILAPLLLLVIGGTRLVIRRRRRDQYIRQVADQS